jgi:hemoglobin-like flavoprotein
MTPEQVADVQQSFALVVPIAQQAGVAFYGKLFEIDPSLRPMFKDDIEEQAGKLMQVLAFAVANLQKPDALMPAVRALGARHGALGIKPHHYDTVAQALLDTLAGGLGPAFTPAVKASWVAAYTILAGEMIAAAA